MRFCGRTTPLRTPTGVARQRVDIWYTVLSPWLRESRCADGAAGVRLQLCLPCRCVASRDGSAASWRESFGVACGGGESQSGAIRGASGASQTAGAHSVQRLSAHARAQMVAGKRAGAEKNAAPRAAPKCCGVARLDSLGASSTLNPRAAAAAHSSRAELLSSYAELLRLHISVEEKREVLRGLDATAEEARSVPC